MTRSAVRRCTLVSVLALLLTACGNGGDAEGPLAIEDARARSTAPSAERGAVYLDLINDTDHDISLTSASVSPDIAGIVELHETVAADNDDTDDMGDMDDDMDAGDGDQGDMAGMGAMSMREVPSIDVAASETVRLEPGGLHVMLLELAGPLEAGGTFELTLSFDDGSDQMVTVEVADEV